MNPNMIQFLLLGAAIFCWALGLALDRHKPRRYRSSRAMCWIIAILFAIAAIGWFVVELAVAGKV